MKSKLSAVVLVIAGVILGSLAVESLRSSPAFGQANRAADRKYVGISATPFRDGIFLFRAWDNGTVDVIEPNIGDALRSPQTWTDPMSIPDPKTFIRAPEVPAGAPRPGDPVRR